MLKHNKGFTQQILRDQRGPLRDLGLRVSRAFFNGLRAPKDEIAVLQGSIACSLGLQGLYFLKFEKIAMGIVLAPGLPSFQNDGLQQGSSDPPPLGGPHQTGQEESKSNDRSKD